MKTLLIFICSITLVSCTEISFKEPQPKNVKALRVFPSRLIGKYLIPEDSSARVSDTLTIEKISYHITGNSPDNYWNSKGILSDSLVLKKYKGFYFLNFKTDHQWVVRVFKQDKNKGIILYNLNLSDEKIVEQLKSKFHAETIKVDSDTYYRVDLTPTELVDFIKQYYKPEAPLKKNY